MNSYFPIRYCHLMPRWLGMSVLFLFLMGIHSCGNPRGGDLFGVVQMEQATDSEGILVYLPGTQYRAYTDQNGSFLITQIPPGAYEAVTQVEGFEEYRQPVQIQNGRRASIGPILLRKPHVPQGRLSGFITLQGNTSHDGIMVLLVGTSLTAETNTTGFFQISGITPENYQLLAIKDGWLPATQSGIQIEDGKETELPTLELRIAAQEPTPIPEIPVLGDLLLQGAAFLEGESDHAGIKVSLESLPAKFTSTDATGNFQLTGLDEQPYSLVFSRPGYLTEIIRDATPVSADSGRSCGFITLMKEYQPEELGVLQGRVYLQNEIVHSNSTVHLSGVAPPVWTDDEGRYKFVAVPAGKYILTVEHPGYQPGRLDEVEIKANQVVQAPDLTLIVSADDNQQGSGTIVGLAMLEGETDQGGILIAVENTPFNTVTGPDGQFSIPDVPVGAYTLIFSKGGFKNQYLEGVPVNANQTTPLEPVLLPRDVEPPYVVDSFPRNHARRIPIFRFIDVILRFSDRMDGNSVKRSVFIDPPVSFEAFFDRESELSDLDTLHLRLYQDGPMPVTFSTTYRITLSPEAATPKGVHLAQPFDLFFTTEGPLIVDSFPRPNDGQFPVNAAQRIMIETNAPVDQTTFERSFRFHPSPDSIPMVNYLPLGIGTRITIETNLRANTRYRLMISNSLRTLDGKRFANTPYTLNFRTVEVPIPGQDFNAAIPFQSSPRRRR